MDPDEFPAIDKLTEIFLAGHKRLPEPWRTAPLGLCLSGGADSCALAFVAREAFEQAPEQFPAGISALHARHALRGSESEGDAASLRELCGRLGLALTEIDAPITTGPGLEARARQARYSAIRDAVGPGVLLATAHHREDQTETVILRLLRGAGVVGLRGIHALRSDGVWRPFLAATRTGLGARCDASGWVSRQDSSNSDTTFARNRLRHESIPALEREIPGFSQGVAQLADAAQRLEPYLERALSRLSEAIKLRLDDHGFSCDVSSVLDPATNPELELVLDRAWTRLGRRPWATAQRQRLLQDVASGTTGRRNGGQTEIAIWGAKRLRVERRS